MLPRADALLDADPGEPGLLVQQAQNLDPGLRPWGSLMLVAFGAVTARNPERSRETTVLPVPPSENVLGFLLGRNREWAADRRRNRPDRAPRNEKFLCLDLVFGDPVERFRVVQSRFVYDWLGDRAGSTARENFRHLVEEVVGRSPDRTHVSRTVTDWLVGEKPAVWHFPAPEAYEGYVRWLFLWPAAFPGRGPPEA